MSTEFDFQKAVVGERGDDGPRLFYADWLDNDADSEGPCPECDGVGTVEIKTPGTVTVGPWRDLRYRHQVERAELRQEFEDYSQRLRRSISIQGITPARTETKTCETCKGERVVDLGRAEHAAFVRRQCEKTDENEGMVPGRGWDDTSPPNALNPPTLNVADGDVIQRWRDIWWPDLKGQVVRCDRGFPYSLAVDWHWTCKTLDKVVRKYPIHLVTLTSFPNTRRNHGRVQKIRLVTGTGEDVANTWHRMDRTAHVLWAKGIQASVRQLDARLVVNGFHNRHVLALLHLRWPSVREWHYQYTLEGRLRPYQNVDPPEPVQFTLANINELRAMVPLDRRMVEEAARRVQEDVERAILGHLPSATFHPTYNPDGNGMIPSVEQLRAAVDSYRDTVPNTVPNPSTTVLHNTIRVLSDLRDQAASASPVESPTEFGVPRLREVFNSLLRLRQIYPTMSPEDVRRTNRPLNPDVEVPGDETPPGRPGPV